jgi:hypothetical protein
MKTNTHRNAAHDMVQDPDTPEFSPAPPPETPADAQDNAVEEHDNSDVPAVSSPPAPAIVPVGDIDQQSIPSLVEPLERALETASNFGEVKQVRDHAEVLRVWLSKVNAGVQAQNRIAEIKIRAERRMGEELRKLEKAKGGGDQRSDHRSHDAIGGPATLAELGINKSQSSRWQTLASVPDVDFEQFISKVGDSGGELTTAAMLQFARRRKREDEPPGGPGNSRKRGGPAVPNSPKDGADGGSQWVIGILQAMGILAEAAFAPPEMPNCDRITDLVREVFHLLAPTFLKISIPKKRRTRLVTLLRDRCGYKDFVDQMQGSWAKADATATERQSDIFSDH